MPKRTTVLTCVAGAFCLVLSPAVAQTPPAATGNASKTMEQAFKNIQVLKSYPADQLMPTMQFISASLGVDCEFCHVRGAFDKDDKPEKKTARKMMEMELAINANHFDNHREVTCYTCHRAAHDPVGTPVISDAAGKPEAPAHESQTGAAATPTADQIVDRYVQALGGAEAIQKISSRVEKGTLTANGQQTPIEVYAKAPDKRVSIMKMPNGDSITAFDGHSGWLGVPGRPPRMMNSSEADGARLDADLHFATDLKQNFTSFRVGRPEQVGGRDAQVVYANRQGLPPVKLYFDKESGLLVRMVRYTETPLGRNPAQVDYADYRDEDGVKVPFRWTLARPANSFTIQIDQVQQNVPVDDAKFAQRP